MKILITVPLPPEAVHLLETVEGAEVILQSGITTDTLREILGECQVLIAGSETELDGDTLHCGKELRVIGLIGGSQTRTDLESATHLGILVVKVQERVAVSIAEHAVTLLLSLSRRITEADASIKRGDWERNGLKGRELRGKTLGIIGFGEVGALVAERAAGMKMRIIVSDPNLSSESVEAKGYRKVSFQELIQSSDLISIHVPLNAGTRGLIGKEALSKMKPGVILVSCSATGILDEEALYEAIIHEEVQGAALDLPAPRHLEDHPLYLSEKVICTPNLGGYTKEAERDETMETIRSLVDYLTGGEITHALNLPGSETENSPRNRQWLRLGETLGLFLAQLHPCGFRKIEIDLAGGEDLPRISSFTRSILVGLYSLTLGEKINRINAVHLATQRGVRLKETRRKTAENYRNRITVSVETDQGSGRVSGTLFDNRSPRIIRIDGFDLEAVPDGDFLVIFNRDRPGVIADVGEILGRCGINIGQMYNGRNAAGGTAITLSRVDSPVPDEILREIETLPNILNASRVHLGLQ